MLGRTGFVFFVPNRYTDGPVRVILADLAANATGFYRDRAVALLAAHPVMPAPDTANLVEKLQADQPKVQRTFVVDDPAAVAELVLTWDMDAGGGMRVLLNGTTIMDVSIDPGRWRNARDTPIPLKPSTLALLQPGDNVLTVEIDPGRRTTGANCSLVALLKR